MLGKKVLGWFGFDAAEDNEVEEENENIYDYGTSKNEDYEEENETRGFFSRKNKLVSMPSVEKIKTTIIQLQTFEQSEDVCDLLKNRQSVIVNLEHASKENARRIVDFISGATLALNGSIQKISNSIFIVAPDNYEIASKTTREEIKSKISLSFLNKNF